MTIDPSLPLILVLLGLLGLRARVSPRASVFVRAPAQAVFAALDLGDGFEQHWHRAKVAMRRIPGEIESYRIHYTSTLSTGKEQVSHADFTVAERQAPQRLVLDRAGLDGQSLNNQLLRIEADLEPAEDGTKLALTYHWGPRPLIAQLLARTELWGGIYRLKGVAETGRADNRSETLITVGVAAVTGLVTFVGFGFWFGWLASFVLLVALFVHEFGHLLAYRMIGQPWGRMVFLPFLGGLAVPRLPFESEAQSVFAALMGPGFSLILPALAAIALFTGAPAGAALAPIGLVASAFNLFNLLPIVPLDGGVALKPIFGRLFGPYAGYALAAVGVVVAIVGIAFDLVVITVLGGVAALANLWGHGGIATGRRLSSRELALAVAGFAVVTAAHILAVGLLYEAA